MNLVTLACLLVDVSGVWYLVLNAIVSDPQITAYVLPGLTRDEKRLLAPVMFGSSALFFAGCALRVSFSSSWRSHCFRNQP